MSKLSKEELARYAGANWAVAIAQRDGVEAAVKELDWRGAKGIPLGVKKTDIDKFCEEEKANTVATVAIMAATVLLDEFDMKPEEIDRFWKRFTDKTECLLGKFVKWEELRDVLKDEAGLDFQLPEVFFEEDRS